MLEGDESSFGSSVALSADGRRLVVGAPFNSEGGTYSGKAYVYTIFGDDITLVAEFLGEAAGDYSGRSVAISDDGKRVAVGAPLNDGGGTNSGHVRIYQQS